MGITLFFLHINNLGWRDDGRDMDKYGRRSTNLMDGFVQQPGGFSAIDGDGMMNGMMYPLVNQHSYEKWPFLVDILPIKNGDFP